MDDERTKNNNNKKQLIKFKKIGVGKFTENNTVITPALIAITNKRLNQLLPTLTAKQRLQKTNASKQGNQEREGNV